jgi:hypothetical protein
MMNRAAYSTVTVFLLMVSLLLDGLGLLWLFVGMFDGVSKVVIKGITILVAGLCVGAVANFLK